MNEAEIKQEAHKYADKLSLEIDYSIAYAGFIAGAEANAPRWTLCTEVKPLDHEMVHLWAKDELSIVGTYWSFSEQWYDLKGDQVFPTHYCRFPSPPNTQP